MRVGRVVIKITPPIPKINLPNNAILNYPLIAVIRDPKIIVIIEIDPTILTPYRSTSIPAGMAKKIPGMKKKDISNPAFA